MKFQPRRESQLAPFVFLGSNIVSSEKNTIKTLCDDARLQIAEVLPQIAARLAARAVGEKDADIGSGSSTEISLPHLKVLMELADFLNLVAVERKTRSSDENPPESQPAEQPSAATFLALLAKKTVEEAG